MTLAREERKETVRQEEQEKERGRKEQKTDRDRKRSQWVSVAVGCAHNTLLDVLFVHGLWLHTSAVA